ncbi:adenylate/guanylate cyclase domain-containing protein [Microvirga massiliensis]|uniref:adenylate/guanylate cyclase domain-containing protein n=1 Tax=Microvirga massiliensis TaxID=1033741 RepID=UPI00065FB34A|nr:adenylate/guanylate cyclase domain-containing protein [Microvirga massiliensis]
MDHAEITAWIVEQGLTGAGIRDLLDGFAQRVIAAGVPLLRAYIALPTVNPNFRVANHTWTRSAGAAVEWILHEEEPGTFDRSPFAYMLANGLRCSRWRDDALKSASFPAFATLKTQGATDYIAHLVRFERAQAPALTGAALSFATDQAGGFRTEHVALLASLVPPLSLAAYRIALLDLTISVLDAYVGPHAGRHVLGGEMRRGSGQTIETVLLVADLRGFTPLADIAKSGELIQRLGEHLEAMAGPIEAHSGEILNFLGDGLLAIVPIGADMTLERAAASAVEAARAALAANSKVNELHSGEQSLALDVALHYGTVFYGNIGSRTRLDFTVIGPAVNEASRMEALCTSLGESLLLSEPIAKACGWPVRSLGRHHLRGVEDERELFGIAEDFNTSEMG